jgi:putative ABC transport system permease protein
MIKNYLKIACRNIAKNKAFSVINILGLAIGMAVCFVIVLYVQHELSYDRFNKNADRIVRVVFKASVNGGKIDESNVMPPVAAALKADYPEVEMATRLHQDGRPTIVYNNKTFRDGQAAFVDGNFFDVFSIQFIQGDAATALMQPNSVVLTSTIAEKYFGNTDPMGKTITYNNTGLFKVTGIIAPIPTNAHFHFDIFGSMSTINQANDPSWLTSSFFTYVLLRKGYDYKKLEAKMPGMVEKYMGPQILQSMGISLAQFRSKGNQLGFVLQPLTAIHLYSHTSSEFEPGGDIKYIYIFSAIAVFMLLIASINFINLSTAGASKRAKETGIRKVLGSGKLQLIKQFLLESLLVTALALVMAALLVQLSLPFFNELAGKQLAFGGQLKTWCLLLAMGLLVGLLAGIYPAFFLSSFAPIATLKGRFRASTGSMGLRSGLVVFQFFISVSLITGTFVVYRQMNYIQNKKLGYSKEQLMVVNNSWALGANEKNFKAMLLQNPAVESVTVSGYKPAGPTNSNNSLVYPEGHQNDLTRAVRYGVDEQYIPTLGIAIAAGRNFSTQMATDSTAIIVNEAAAAVFGWGNNAVGKSVVWVSGDEGRKVSYHIIGIVKDFHFKSLHDAIAPLLMVMEPGSGLIVKVKTAQVAGLLQTMKAQWAGFKTEEPFSYAFMDELYIAEYIAEQKTSRILQVFAVLTIFVACMGLFGLATYTAEQRSKEIGIRKVLGASVSQVTQMLSKEFMKLVLLGCVLAFPLSWWAMHTWLQDFAYRTTLSWWIFIAAGAAAMLIALLTVCVKAIRAALANPVVSLRSE